MTSKLERLLEISDKKTVGTLEESLTVFFNNKFTKTKYPFEEIQKLIYSLSEIEDSFCKFQEEQLPKLLKEKDIEKTYDILIDILEEFRHVIYHIKDSKFLSDFLKDDLHQVKEDNKMTKG